MYPSAFASFILTPFPKDFGKNNQSEIQKREAWSIYDLKICRQPF